MTRIFTTSRVLVVVVLFVAYLGGWMWLTSSRLSRSSTDVLRQARTALRQGRHREASELALKISEDSPDFPAAMVAAAEAAVGERRLADAVTCLQKVPRDGSAASLDAASELSAILSRLGSLSTSIRALEYVTTHRPDDSSSHSRLAFLLRVAGRRADSIPHLTVVMRSGKATLRELALLADRERPFDVAAFLQECHRSFPDDTHVRLGLAVDAAIRGQTPDARSEAESIVETHPKLMAAQVLLGEMLVEDRPEVFDAWHTKLPPAAEQSSDIWYLRGLHAVRQGLPELGATCFRHALKLEPTHRLACFQMGRCLTAIGHPAGEAFAERARELHQFTRKTLKDLTTAAEPPENLFREVIEVLRTQGRVPEAAAWTKLSSRMFPNSRWPADLWFQLAGGLQPGTPIVVDEKNLVLLYDLAQLPSFSGFPRSSGRKNPPTSDGAMHSGIQFTVQADAGMDFVYRNAADLQTSGARMQEQTGGGVSVADIDLDQWPDLYLVQGAEWPSGSRTSVPVPGLSDRVLRNRMGRNYDDVTSAAGVAEFEFGQSCAVGDLDEDGFPDLYVANIGPNTLFRNNGDGTFSVTVNPAAEPETWTSSAAIADLNGDGLADLVDVNYLSGDEVYVRICNGLACSPGVFSGTPARLHISQGDGTFETTTASTSAADSKGLGLIVAGISDLLQPSVLIANDQTPKFLLNVVRNGTDDRVQLQDTAFPSGLAYDGEGLLTAAMGIAADDVDHNGLLDFLVTNFNDESNTFYSQVGPGVFQDVTRAANLMNSSVPFVSWGTQFLDADLDGESDLVVANGHVDDYRPRGGEFHMRPQLFQGMGQARFRELAAEQAGEFFSRPLLGRGLAKLDWNSDGRTDFVISNLDSPTLLVSNTTQHPGHFLNVRLHATRSSRDAICARVEIEYQGRTVSKQLVAGDGYHASNERLLQFGLGDCRIVDRVTVRWPSGSTTRVEQIPVDATLAVVEQKSLATTTNADRSISLPTVTIAAER